MLTTFRCGSELSTSLADTQESGKLPKNEEPFSEAGATCSKALGLGSHRSIFEKMWLAHRNHYSCSKGQASRHWRPSLGAHMVFILITVGSHLQGSYSSASPSLQGEASSFCLPLVTTAQGAPIKSFLGFILFPLLLKALFQIVSELVIVFPSSLLSTEK